VAFLIYTTFTEADEIYDYVARAVDFTELVGAPEMFRKKWAIWVAVNNLGSKIVQLRDETAAAKASVASEHLHKKQRIGETTAEDACMSSDDSLYDENSMDVVNSRGHSADGAATANHPDGTVDCHRDDGAGPAAEVDDVCSEDAQFDTPPPGWSSMSRTEMCRTLVHLPKSCNPPTLLQTVVVGIGV